MRKIDYNQTIYGVDIETSTIHMYDGKQYFFNGFEYVNIKNKNDILPLSTKIEKSVSYMISYCVSSLDTWNGEYREVNKGRTYEELDRFLYELNKNVNGRTLIYCHNFSYEFSFFINNIPTLKTSEMFFMDKNKPLKVTYDNLEFRCSYLLLNKSIAKLGSELNLPKLDFEYNKVRTPLSQMTSKEWEYNFRDVEIMLKSIYQLILNNQYIQSVADIPLTKTGISRFNCKSNMEINKKVSWLSKGDRLKTATLHYLQQWESEFEKAKSEKQLEFWERLFKGGFVYSNPKYFNTTINNVMSFDFSSDYPFQMLFRKFPRNFNQIKTKTYQWELLNEILENANSNQLISDQPYKYMINCIVKIKNINAKYSTLPLSESNIEERLRNGIDCIILNGKIKSITPEVTMYLTHIDLIVLKLFYNFEIVDICYLEKATKIRESSSYRINCVLFNGNKKSEYKVYKELIEKENQFKIYDKELIKDGYVLKELNKQSTYQEQLNTINKIYQQVKADLNSLYGDNAQHLNRPIINYDFTDHDFKEEKADFEENYKNKKKNTSYIYGLYVPAYARASILYFAYEFAKKDTDILYIDTDSLKIKEGDFPKVKDIINNYNLMIKSEITDKYNLDFGTLEYEHTFAHFNSMGCKSYVYMLNGRIYATISGLPKANELYQSLYKICNNDFELLIKKCYHNNVVIDSTVANKLCAIYKYEKQTIFVNGYYDTLYSGCVLKPVNLHMQDTNQRSWNLYTHLINSIYKNQINKKYTKIIKNKKGDIEIC